MAVDTLPLSIRVCPRETLNQRQEGWRKMLRELPSTAAVGRDPRWIPALCDGLRHASYVLTANNGSEMVGVLPLVLVRSVLFGRFLVSLPYVNSAGILARDPAVAHELIDEAIRLSNGLGVRYLELRHEGEVEHPELDEKMTAKVHMRLQLPATADELMASFKSKLRSQVRSGEKKGLEVRWGRGELLGEFYGVFARNMRDLGTPVYGRRLFRAILTHFEEDAELCVVRHEGRPIAGGIVVHGEGITEVPSASSLKEFNSLNANMLLYWNLLERAIARGQKVFDFGRCDEGGSHFRFKAQWGAEPSPAVWQYYVRNGSPGDMRPQSAKYRFLVRTWQKLPTSVASAIGPAVIRGIP